MQFLPNAELAIDEWAARLAPGGVLVISQPRPGLTPREAVLHLIRENCARRALPALRFVAAHLALAGMRLRWCAPTTRSAHLGSSTLVACGTQLLTTQNAAIDPPST